MDNERYVYIIRLVKEDYSLPHTKVFVDKDLADRYFDNDLKYYRKKDWDVSDSGEICVGTTIRRATMRKKTNEGIDNATLIMETFEIIKK